MSKDKNQSDLEDRLIEFAVRIIQLAGALPKSQVGKHLSGQLIRCGTSPAPNYGEAQGAESRSDFIHKMKVCLKELRETKVWLKMIVKAELIKPVSILGNWKFLVGYWTFAFHFSISLAAAASARLYPWAPRPQICPVAMSVTSDLWRKGSRL